MMRATYERAADVFQRALEVREQDRARFIESECEGDAGLLAIVRSLLRSDAQDSFLDHPAALPAARSADHLTRAEELVSIGDYRIIETIASGSMGVVFLAEQASPRRNVALKLLTIDDAATSSLLAEATLLGRLQHPGVARIYEAGTAEARYEGGETSSATFIAMEHIEGKTLREYAREASLTKREVAGLLLSITTAIVHAHRRGVIHRDLKPSNILIDPAGNPHLIDFGVGLLREDAHDSDGTHIAGTSAYMAPEQLVGRVDQVDTRVDIYSIGVIGYELLTGTTPHQPTNSIEEALLNRIRASERDTSRALRHAAGSELSRVIARALAANRDQRHPSASALADDLRCVIEGRPVGGADSSPARSLWMYARRHRLAATLLGAAFILCVAATAGLGISWSRAREAAARADAAAAEIKVQASNAERIADFLKTAFLGVDPEERGVSVTLFDAIDYAAGRIHRDLADAPAVEADVRSAIGFVYRRQGRLADAFEQTRIAHRLYIDLYGVHDERTAAAAEELAYLTWIYEGDADSALQSFEQIISRDHEMAKAGHQSDGWIRVKAGLIALAVDDLASAERHLVAAEPLLVEAYGDVFAARSLRHRALVRLYAGQTDEAEKMARAAFEMCIGAAEQEYITARCLVTLAEVLTAQGRFEEALLTLDDAAVLLTKLTSSTGPDFANLNLIAARAEHESGNTTAATDRLRDVIRILESTVSPSHPDLAEARAYLAAYESQSNTERRERLATAHEIVDRSHGPDHRLSIASLNAALKLAEDTGDDYTARRLRTTITALEKRRAARIGPDLHRSHPELSF